MILTKAMTQQELERLIKESQVISQDWDAYIQFCRNRDEIMKVFIPDQGLN